MLLKTCIKQQIAFPDLNGVISKLTDRTDNENVTDVVNIQFDKSFVWNGMCR